MSSRRKKTPPRKAAPPAGRESAERRPWLPRALAALLVALTFAVFGQVRHHDFVDLDDGLYVKDNTNVTSGLTLENVRWAFTTGRAANWHPLTWTSHQVDATLFDLDAGWHHLTSVVWHTLNVVLLFGLLRTLTGAVWRSALVAAFFAVHPAHVESVAWVSERKDVLSTFFWLTSTWAYVSWTREKNGPRLALSVLLFAAGLMSKPMLVTMPVTLLLLDVWPLGRTSIPLKSRVLEKLPFFGLAAASSVVTFIVQQQGGAMSTLDILPFSTRALNAIASYGTYLRQLVWPVNLAVFYPYATAVPVAAVALSGTVLAALSWLVWRWRHAAPFAAVGWSWFLGTLSPVIGLVQIGMQSSADRYTYVPYIGAFVALVWSGDMLARRYGARTWAAAAGLAAAGVLAVVAHAQAGTWRTSESLWTHAVAVTRDNARAHNALGAIYGNSGRVQEAEQHFKEALRLRPDQSEGIHILPNLGRALMAQGKVHEAIPILEQARKVAPDNAEVLNQLGLAYLTVDRADDAIQAWQDAVRLDPKHEGAWFTLGIALAAQGRRDEARAAFGEVLRINPSRQDAADALTRLR